jgi:predicted CoA-binding protein
MKKIIEDFLNSKSIAIVGASTNKDNFGLSLLKELSKIGYRVHPVNPGYDEIEGLPCVDSVKELPEDVEGVILAVPPTLTEEIVMECVETPVKRVWMVKGVGKGAYSEAAHQVCSEHNIDVVYGFCPMMFFGKGLHKFHLWMRKNFSKLPEEYIVN